MKKKVGRNARAQRNHLYIRANLTCLTAQKPQEHAQVGGIGCQKCATTGGGGAVGLILSGYTSMVMIHGITSQMSMNMDVVEINCGYGCGGHNDGRSDKLKYESHGRVFV